jgi:hypothetical protein
MNESESSHLFSALTGSTIGFFVSFAVMVLLASAGLEFFYLISILAVFAFHLLSVYLISSFISSVGKNSLGYAIGAFVVPFWGNAIVYILCRNVAKERGLV